MNNLLYPNSAIQEKRNKVCSLFQSSLFDDSESGSIEAREYLEGRNITKDLISRFRIGWYPENRYVPFLSPVLAGRIIFPIIDEYGDAIAFSGRKMVHNKGDEYPKYFHESYPKAFFPYGMDLAWRNILHKNYAVLTEGQTDVIACHRAGITNAVGVMGSSLKFESFVKLSRFCDRFILMFDYDEAGIKCTKKTEELLTKHNKEFIIVKLKTKEGEFDPDEFSKKYGDHGLSKAIKFYMGKGNRHE